MEFKVLHGKKEKKEVKKEGWKEGWIDGSKEGWMKFKATRVSCC